MKFTKIALLSSVVALSVHAQAADFSYNFVEAGFGTFDTDVNGGEIESEALGFSGSFELDNNLFVRVGYSTEDVDDYDVEGTLLGFGIGGFTPISEKTNAYAQFSFLRAEVEAAGFGSDDDTGYGFDVGIRHMLNEKIEVNAAVGVTSLFDETDTGFGFGGRLHLNDRASFGVNYSKADDTTGMTFSLRFEI